jgi:hypothetical protein
VEKARLDPVVGRGSGHGDEEEGEAMTANVKGWIGFVVAFGMMATSLAPEVQALDSWSVVTSPPFVGKVLLHIGSVIMAFFAGKGIPVEPKA